MAESTDRNIKFFFRGEKLPKSAAVALPEDLQWAATGEDDTEERLRQARAGHNSLAGSGGNSNPSTVDYENYYNTDNVLAVPQILGIVNQYIAQDPQGQGRVNVVLNVAANNNVDVEVRVITR